MGRDDSLRVLYLSPEVISAPFPLSFPKKDYPIVGAGRGLALTTGAGLETEGLVVTLGGGVADADAFGLATS